MSCSRRKTCQYRRNDLLWMYYIGHSLCSVAGSSRRRCPSKGTVRCKVRFHHRLWHRGMNSVYKPSCSVAVFRTCHKAILLSLVDFFCVCAFPCRFMQLMLLMYRLERRPWQQLLESILFIIILWCRQRCHICKAVPSHLHYHDLVDAYSTLIHV